jgi:dolichol-phosphate mannosyltransferase
VAVKLGFFLFLLGLTILLGIVVTKLFIMDMQMGWPSLMGAIILASGLQLFFIGIAAIYVGRTYKETKRRPLFSIKELTNLSPN